MRNIVTAALLGLLLAACAAATPTPSPAPMTAAPVAMALAPPPLPTAPTLMPLPAATIPTAPPIAPTRTPTAILTVAANRSAPDCARLTTATTIPTGQLGSPANPIVIVFEPYIDLNRTINAARAVGDCLSRSTGLAYRTEVAANPAAAVEALGAGRAHVGFLDIPAIVQGRAKYALETGLVSLRTEKETLAPYYQRQFIARKSSGIQTISDLRGKTFCFGEPQSSFGTIVPRIVLAANGIDPAKDLGATRFAGYADQIARAVYSGECDAGTTFVDVLTDPATALARILPDILDKVGVFYITGPIPNDGVQYIRSLDPRLKQLTSDALLAMAPPGVGKREPLVSLYKIEAFIPAGNDFYADFERLVRLAGLDPATLLK